MKFETRLLFVAIVHNAIFLLLFFSAIVTLSTVTGITLPENTRYWGAVTLILIVVNHLIGVYRTKMWKMNAKYGVPVTK